MCCTRAVITRVFPDPAQAMIRRLRSRTSIASRCGLVYPMSWLRRFDAAGLAGTPSGGGPGDPAALTTPPGGRAPLSVRRPARPAPVGLDQWLLWIEEEKT